MDGPASRCLHSALGQKEHQVAGACEGGIHTDARLPACEGSDGVCEEGVEGGDIQS